MEKVEPKIPLSASRIKTCQTCSWLYYAKYVLGIPDKSNDGASKGSVTHLVMEMLGDKEKRGCYFDKIVQAQSVDACPSIARMVQTYANKLGVGSSEDIIDIKNMCLAGINYDFYADGYDKGYSELEFSIVKNDGGKFYRTRGFLDKLFLSRDGKNALIRDFKTSKKVYVGEEITENLQHYMYSLAARHLFPSIESSSTEFLFLRHRMTEQDKSGVVTIDLNDPDIIEGFEEELTCWQLLIDNYSIRNAQSDLAANKPFPTDGTFSGRLCCGYAKYPNALKKDGSPMWYCPAKFRFHYYEIRERETDKRVRSCFIDEKDSLLEKYPKDKYYFKFVEYGGCPAYRQDNIESIFR